mmetsp:Transcript_26401/g.63686  ORF Transcript_26401/g.63686 Transcript_26401/m.63686 type:complete len:659 (-) Transcript_26401:162-2138(-)|eukprot:CAMPEP_0114506794 /NCGR_PEP_ID=MMETSP0109-20121206/11635_1 /TAXON_ID=29199 /ORGANISM="Chlorarachnion reptans, Strain CCCM449" /LENGTH=658 /DNA_ID=CAMNT_0001685441 /DNA_START=117 /DNA_END=2093 /DNA_ORIENTATION=+
MSSPAPTAETVPADETGRKNEEMGTAAGAGGEAGEADTQVISSNDEDAKESTDCKNAEAGENENRGDAIASATASTTGTGAATPATTTTITTTDTTNNNSSSSSNGNRPSSLASSQPRIVRTGNKPAPPAGPPPPTAQRANSKVFRKSLNPVFTQPRPAESPHGSDAQTPTETLPSPSARARGKGADFDKKNPMSQIGQAIGSFWTWAKEKGAKLRERKVADSSPRSRPPDIPFKVKLEMFKKALRTDEKIDRKFVCTHAFLYGAPETPGFRSILWKLLLDYLPYDRAKWKKVLSERRGLYREWVQELVTNPYQELFVKEERQGEVQTGAEGGNNGKPTAVRMQSVAEDEFDPLRHDPRSDWQQFFKDEELREEINKDVMRTYASFSFFLQRVRSSEEIAAVKEARPRKSITVPSGNGESKTKKVWLPSADETHHDVIQRILFVYAKLNPGVRYVQGMNEILAPIYFTFAQDQDNDFRRNAEADAFFCFSNVMTEIRDRFIRTLDCTSAGIIAAVKDLNDLLAKVDKKLYQHLRKLNIDPRFYAFRWLTLLLSQEFELPDTLRLWDSLFADEKRFEYLTYCCCSMLIIYREKLLAGGFAEGLRLLQDYPQTDLHDILAHAINLNLHTKFELQGNQNGQQLVMPIDLDKHLGLDVRRKR